MKSQSPRVFVTRGGLGLGRLPPQARLKCISGIRWSMPDVISFVSGDRLGLLTTPHITFDIDLKSGRATR